MPPIKSDNLRKEIRSKAFEQVRAAHQSETAEDYVEMIADLIEEKGEARVVDLASAFGITHATVNKTIARLNKEGFVVNEKYRSLFLTDKGLKLAQACKERHEIVVNFLKSVGVSARTAELDAEGVEHHISAETLKAFAAHLKKKKA
ncbi:MAG: transcriptional regulator MntR [Micavibrio aeruginosavorus]|uniref:Transcriptional regulator MntR n=1 Tax=Micavibrio aeruginosavorus TaxID=349221 RepID=A0A2W5N3K6_9BACT|nr:MAG: transcriptional regulator MntR [Micavibrio aeruginosavorus]